MRLKRFGFLLVTSILVLSVITANAGLSFIGSGSVFLGSVVGVVRIAGFGNDTDFVTVNMNVQGSGLTAFCRNKGGNEAPGQNPVSVNANTTSAPVAPVRNGTATVEMRVNVLPTPEQAGCPNKNWTVVDLIGTLYVTFSAVDTSTPNPTTITQTLRCEINQRNATISCVPL